MGTFIEIENKRYLNESIFSHDRPPWRSQCQTTDHQRQHDCCQSDGQSLGKHHPFSCAILGKNRQRHEKRNDAICSEDCSVHAQDAKSLENLHSQSWSRCWSFLGTRMETDSWRAWMQQDWRSQSWKENQMVPIKPKEQRRKKNLEKLHLQRLHALRRSSRFRHEVWPC